MAPLQRERASQESGLGLEQNAPLSGTLRAGSYSEGRVWGLDPSPCCSERSRRVLGLSESLSQPRSGESGGPGRPFRLDR